MSDNIFRDELKRIKPLVWNVYRQYLPINEPNEFYDMVRDYPERQGKYFRAGLVLLANKLYGGNENDAYLSAACMQASEDWLLIHDDIEDHSEERRSTKEKYKPTLNALYGDELAINAGDALHAIMWQMLADNARKFNDDRGWRVFDKMQDVIRVTIEGQYQELMWIRNNRLGISEQEYYEMIDKKAGYYTVVAPLSLGAIMAGVLDEDLEQIKKWGMFFGRAFQIWDDVMNLTVNSEVQGKEIAGDIWEGKRTLIMIHLFTHCNLQERAYISNIYSLERKFKTQKQIAYVLDAMRNYDSIKYAMEKAKEFSVVASDEFATIYKNNEEVDAVETIKSAINFVVNRER
ncbi:polyprenyl synthetase family protein [Patescibacteria group bacterium]|nr:polyprenyl synthetase family protein [Patescibacteria group bacterium]